MDVSVIIVNYNTRKLTRACVDSVFQKTKGVSFELIVVDNASTDGSRELFSQDSRITYIYNESNLGFGRANNVGLAAATGRNILFLNSDTLLINDAVSILSDYLDAHPDVGAVGGNLFNNEGHPIHSFHRYRPSVYGELNEALLGFPNRLRFGENAEFNHTDAPLEVKHITGADLMIPRSVLNQIGGGFNPDFFMYHEDTELCWRIGKSGHRLMSVPDAEIVHLVGASSRKSLSRAKVDMFLNSRKLYYKNCKSFFYRLLVYPLIFLVIIVKLVIFTFDKPHREFWLEMLLELFRPIRVGTV